MIFDTHAHYDDEQFNQDRNVLLESMQDNGVGSIVNISASYTSCIDSVKFTHEYPFIYAAVGIHPDEVGTLTEESYQKLISLYDEEKVVAVGEIGLDYHWDTYPRDVQKYWFVRQIEEAGLRGLPIAIHSREAGEATLKIIEKYARGITGVMHAFSYSVELAREYIKLGYYIGIGGVITFKNAKKLKEVVADIPIDQMVLETDAPYLTPEPFRGKRNNSIYLHYVAEEIARIKGIDKEKVIEITQQNANKLYHINESGGMNE